MNLTNSFLEHVAHDLLRKHGTDLSHIAVVFSNKRASLFLNDHLARMAGKPIWSPAYIPISELFRQHSHRMVADQIKLVCELHRSFIAQTGSDETLDHFFGWGQLLLADFDDIDKQMADADRVLANLTDLREMDDDSFLTEAQREVLRRFFSNFTESHTSELKQRFLRLWSHIKDIYHDFNQRLEQQQMAYEGALYREVVTGNDIEFNHDTYIFIGFNALLQVEERLFGMLKQQGKARFYWDFDRYYMKDDEAGHFIRQYLDCFPNELDTDDDSIYRCFSRPKHITIASAATENIQARYATSWLRQLPHVGKDCAIVLCNEGLLPVIIHCLPPEVECVNITTGYPLAQSPVTSMVILLIALRRDGYDYQRGHYRLRHVKAVLRHPYLAEASPQVTPLLNQLIQEKIYFPTIRQLCTDDFTELLFRPFGPRHSNSELIEWLCAVVRCVAKASHLSTSDIPLTTIKDESLFRTYTLLNRLLNLANNGDLNTDIITIGRLITQLMQQTSVPFHGEPAEGLQIMGLLETRCLDFRHLLILSVSEGNLPRGISDTSLIPYALRRAYGLTTPDHKVAIYSYYFHHLLQRADDVTIVYNNSYIDGQKGEMSRFLLQLMVESPHPIEHLTLQGGQDYTPKQPQPVDNKAQLPDMLSPTAINRYLRCPLQFHYYYVCNLQEPDETDDDTIDNRIFGNIFHEAARLIYTQLTQQSPRLTAAVIDHVLKTGVGIERAVDEAFRQELFHLSPQQAIRPRPLSGLQLINREVIIHYLRQLLTLDRQLAPITMLDLEGLATMKLTIPFNGKEKTISIGGRIDRLDMLTDAEGREHIRVIDYKTGAHRLKPLPDVDAIFSQAHLKDHSDYYLQTMLYSIIVASQHKDTPISPALLFIQHAGTEGYDPVLQFGHTPISNVADHAAPFMEQLQQVIANMFDHSIPLTPTTDIRRCNTCPYRQLCYQ